MLLNKGPNRKVALSVTLTMSCRGLGCRGVRVYLYPRVYPYPTRTHGYGSGTGRCLTGRVGYRYEVHG